MCPLELLLTLLLTQLSLGLLTAPEGLHPQHVLSTLTAPAQPSEPQLQPRTVREEEVLSELSRVSHNNDNRKLSTSFMVELFNSFQRGKRGRKAMPASDTIRGFSGKRVKMTQKGAHVVQFHIPQLPTHEQLQAAEIRFLRRTKLRPRSRKYTFKVEVRKHQKLAGKFTFRERSQAQRKYEVFDVTKLLQPWIRSFHGNVSLNVRVSRKLQRQSLVQESGPQSTSLVVLYLEDREFLKTMYESFVSQGTGEGRRVRRDARGETSRSHEANSAGGNVDTARFTKPDSSIASNAFAHSSSIPTVHKHNRTLQHETNRVLSGRQPSHSSPEVRPRRSKRESNRPRRRRNRRTRKWYRHHRREPCQLYDFEVDFNLLGWGRWILHPKRFNSRFCLGSCPAPVPGQFSPTNHAVLQTLMRLKRPNAAPVPCCVPSKLSALSMLYLEDDEIVVRHHEEMVATECGCR